MLREVREFPHADAVAAAAADYVVLRASAAIAARGQFHFAVSGGRTPWTMFEKLALMDVDWPHVVLYQTDERVAPPGDVNRNLTNLERSLGECRPTIVAMPVNDDDLDASANSYANLLPSRFDLVHLGLGADGHTASLIPGDPVLDERVRLVAVSGAYHGVQRMTLTYPGLARADQLLWLIFGANKQPALSALLRGDPSIPASGVEAASAIVMADEAALGS